MPLKIKCIALVVLIAASAVGCLAEKKPVAVFKNGYTPNLDTYQGPSLPIQEPAGISIGDSPSSFEMEPLDDFSFSEPGRSRLMSLEECIFAALQSSPIIRELGGATLRSPDQVSTIHDPALAYSDPRFGEEAALSEFDAKLNSQFIFRKNDRAFNNTFIGNNGFLQQNLGSYRSGLSKLSATGALFEFNHAVDYDQNNSPSNRFNGGGSKSFAYDTFLEAGFRQPLMQGAGVNFNRIAGPNNAPGVNNGVLIARTNTDITLAEFEAQLRNLVSDVENAYWDLYYAYRDLETRIEARNGAYDTWASIDATEQDAAITNQAKEQYYRFAADVENSIHGRLNDGTRTNNGSSGGTFRNGVGVRTAERRLRLITGMLLNDSQLVVPKDQPTDAAVVFDWEQAKSSALVNRPELRKQRWQVKRRELELLASRNHLLPRVDLLGKYRVRGFGENLFGEQGFTAGPNVTSGSAATASMLDGDLQEWELGVDVNVPIGYRRQHAAKRNAELSISREKAILNEQERQVIYGLTNALGELKRSTRVRESNSKRLEAAKAQYDAIKIVYEEEGRTIDQLLEAQRRVIEAKTQYYQSQVENMLALRSVHFEKGTLFNYHNVKMAESAWTGEAYQQLNERATWNKKRLNYAFSGLKVSEGVNSAEGPNSWSEVVGDFVAKRSKIKQEKSDAASDAASLAELVDSSDSSLLALSKMADAQLLDSTTPVKERVAKQGETTKMVAQLKLNVENLTPQASIPQASIPQASIPQASIPSNRPMRPLPSLGAQAGGAFNPAPPRALPVANSQVRSILADQAPLNARVQTPVKLSPMTLSPMTLSPMTLSPKTLSSTPTENSTNFNSYGQAPTMRLSDQSMLKSTTNSSRRR